MHSLTLISILYILTCVGFLQADAAEDESTCTTKVKCCKLDIDPELFTKGPKGERGDKGHDGVIGAKGTQGLRGDQGVQGNQGPKGESGDMERKGEKGDEARSTIVGQPGRPGTPGTFVSEYEDEEDAWQDFPCDNDKQEKTINIGPSEAKFQAYCGPNPREICIPKQPSPRELYNYKEKEKPFWITKVGIDNKNLYGLTNVQMEWLKGKSTYVRQTLRYYCENSRPYSAHDISKSVRLLTWNDKVLGPYPTDVTPLFYSVPVDTDGCSMEGADSKYTEIKIQTAVIKRLPIIDVQINDIRNESQAFRIEHMELCFAVFQL